MPGQPDVSACSGSEATVLSIRFAGAAVAGMLRAVLAVVGGGGGKGREQHSPAEVCELLVDALESHGWCVCVWVVGGWVVRCRGRCGKESWVVLQS